jgi:tripartite-type tricarboxylate transporter receptor subunit TctC
MTIDTPFTVNPALYPSMPFKPGDLKPIAIVASSSLMFAVHPKLGVGTISEFLNVAKTRVVAFSSADNGSPGHVGSAMLAEQTGAKINKFM